ncbi:MAG TPA: mechanosensitive ion channel family protein [Nitrolancea sp.]|nr:mechanosensitive ion channel family protein [Nitrolancea sp.]
MQVNWSRLSDFGRTTIGPIISVLVIVALALVILRVMRTLIRRMIRHLVERNEKPNRELTLKINTLSSVVESGGRALVIVLAAMMILSNIGINIAPLLASAGVVGIAIGLGAQSLIKDVIGGFLILFEDQYGVGDVISVNGFSGSVEHLSLRRTGLRGADGSFTVIANGDVRAVQNLTKDWSRAIIDVDISHDDDIDQAVAALTDMLDGIQDDPELGDAILAPADILGVQAMGPYQVTLRVMIKTRPMEQWRVQRVLLRRIKQGFYRTGATIPYPRNETVVRAIEEQPAPTPVFAGTRDDPAPADE